VADQTGLRFIGLGFSAVTAVVTLIAAFIVIGANPELTERPAITAVVTR
jgi:hypothetical protein